MPAPIITLTTDLGNKDPYVPAVKGYILGRQPGANIIDITHRVTPFHIAEASFILKGCFADFPEGTIHIISVDADYEMEQRFIAAAAAGHYFICPDNGVLSLIIEEEQISEVVELPFTTDQLVSPLKNILTPAACSLLTGEALNSLGSAWKGFVRKTHMQPVMEESIMRGTVIYVDNHGNAITNIERNHFGRYGENRKLQIYIRRNEYFDRMYTHYNEVPEGEKVCLFGTNGLLEIGINKGNASGLLGLKPGHTILVEFL
jgi:S-adenosylmethionine hydrolase